MRLTKLRQILTDSHLDAIVISQPENRRYLSGFTGTKGTLFISPGRAILAVPFVYLEQARKQAPAFELLRFQREFAEVWPDLVAEISSAQQCRARRVAFESAYLTVAEHGKLIAGVKDAELVPMEGIVVGAGPNGAMPHQEVSERVIGTGEPIVMDLGAQIAGYHSDLTRTICLSQPDGWFTGTYDLVLRAQLAAEAAIWRGIVAGEIDNAARQIITEAGYGEQYGHGLGHGVGLAVHEEPFVRQGAEEVLKPGMVLTVEPGIYLPDWGGVRVEDMVLVREDGVEVLSRAVKEPVITR